MSKRVMKWFLEITALPINALWKGRKVMRSRTLRTAGRYYDWDFNLVRTSKDSRGTTYVYRLADDDLEKMPNNQMEKLVHLMSSTEHQAVLILHVYVQGNNMPIHKN